MTKPDDHRLLSSLRAGRPEACAELIRDQYPTVYRFLVHLTRDVHQAEDLTQETFIAAWEKIATFEGRANLATWLHRIATKFIDARRAGTRGVSSASEPKVGRRSDRHRDGHDEANAVRECMGLAVDRSCSCCHLQGWAIEMASVLDGPSGTVKWRVKPRPRRGFFAG